MKNNQINAFFRSKVADGELFHGFGLIVHSAVISAKADIVTV